MKPEKIDFMIIRTAIFLLTSLAAFQWASANEKMSLNDLKGGGLPKSVKSITLKTKSKILLVTKTIGRSKTIFKMLDYETGRPVSFPAGKVAISKIGDHSPKLETFKKLLKEAPSFLITVNPVNDKTFYGSRSRKIVVITTKGALDKTSPSKRLENAYEMLLMEAKQIIVFQSRNIIPLTLELARGGNNWVKFQKKQELFDALSFVETRRNRIERLGIKLDIHSIVEEVDETEKTKRFSKEIEAYTERLRLFHALFKEIRRKFELAKKFKRDAEALERSVRMFQEKQKMRRQETVERLERAFESLMLESESMYARQAEALQGLAVQYAIKKSELEEYRAWLEAEEEARQAEVEQSYYNSTDYGDDWNNFQLMHQTSRMQFNSFYGKNWDHRPATDGRQ